MNRDGTQSQNDYSPSGKFYNRDFFNNEYGDFEHTIPQLMKVYTGRNDPDELDFSDVWDSTYMNVHFERCSGSALNTFTHPSLQPSYTR